MTRQNFYQGQSLAPEHLNTMQDYVDNGNANLISALLGYGVVNGFELSHENGHIISVSSGLAFNLAGERLVLSEDTQVNLSQHISSDKTIKLGIIMDYVQSEPVLDSMGYVINTKWTPTVQFVSSEVLDAGVFELAEITVDSNSVTNIKTTSSQFSTTLQKHIQNTSVLSTNEGTSTLQNDVLNFNSPLINLITPALQLNGTPFIEYGSNENGHFLKFENGTLICWGKTSCDVQNSIWIFPYEFIEQGVLLNAMLQVDGAYKYSVMLDCISIYNTYLRTNSNTNYLFNGFGNGDVFENISFCVLGRWK